MPNPKKQRPESTHIESGWTDDMINNYEKSWEQQEGLKRQQEAFRQFHQQLSPISLKINGQDIYLYEWKLFSQEEKIKYAEIYGNGSYCENTIICYLDNNTEPIDKLYFIGFLACIHIYPL